jgi:3-deoxy-7-phosphoheptulonate synthase
VGFKNGTDGNTKIAIDGILAAAASHHFLSVTKFGNAAIIKTAGNPFCHLILRGGAEPNYHPAAVRAAVGSLAKANLPPRLMVDCSHANSQKDFRRQVQVVDSIADQLRSGSRDIFAVMIESHLQEGNQSPDTRPLRYGVSITDACLGWEATREQLQKLAEAQRQRRG